MVFKRLKWAFQVLFGEHDHTLSLLEDNQIINDMSDEELRLALEKSGEGVREEIAKVMSEVKLTEEERLEIRRKYPPEMWLDDK